MTAKPLWVLRDLSNGDGADGRPSPTYIWVFKSRAKAREQARKHRKRSGYSTLGPVERWPSAVIAQLYEQVAERGPAVQYYERRGR